MRYIFYLKKITQGIILTLIIFMAAYMYKSDIYIGEFFLAETLPYYRRSEEVEALFKLNPTEPVQQSYVDSYELLYEDETEATEAKAEKEGAEEESREKEQKQEAEGSKRIEINNVSLGGSRLVVLDEGIFQPETDHENTVNHNFDEFLTVDDLDKLHDLTYLRGKFYIVDPRTDLSPDLFDVDKFMNTDLSIKKSDEPKILIFHTHSQEMFSDSQSISEGIFAVGDALASLLSERYSIKTIHNTDSFDIVDGKSQIQGAYERMEPVISRILEENPSIEMVIDLHRDGLPAGALKQTADINGKRTAQIMFFNGLTRLMDNGELKKIEYLPNNYLDTNLALSFNMQLAANSMYPGFTKKVYLNAYRYSLHMMPKSLFVEVGSQYNTKEEAVNSAEPLAEIIARVVGDS